MTRPIMRPVTSYGPELLALLLKGAREEIIIRHGMPNGKGGFIHLPWNKARQMQLRMYQLRSSMRRENHSMHDLACRARIHVRFGHAAGFTDLPEVPSVKLKNGETYPRGDLKMTTPGMLRIAPQDSEFADIAGAIGISTTDLQESAVLLDSTDAGTAIDNPLSAFEPKGE